MRYSIGETFTVQYLTKFLEWDRLNATFIQIFWTILLQVISESNLMKLHITVTDDLNDTKMYACTERTEPLVKEQKKFRKLKTIFQHHIYIISCTSNI